MNQASNNSSKATEIRTRLFQENGTCKLEFIFPSDNKIIIDTEEPDTQKKIEGSF